MIIKVTFGDYREYDYVYSPNNIGLKKENLKDNFYEWIDNTEDKSYLIESFTDKSIDYDIKISL